MNTGTKFFIVLYFVMLAFIPSLVGNRACVLQEFTICDDHFIDTKVIITENVSIAKKEIQKYLQSDTAEIWMDDKDVVALTLLVDGKSVLWISDLKDKGLIAHEISHLTWNILQWTGTPLSNDTNEIYAYENQFLTNQFYKNVKTN